MSNEVELKLALAPKDWRQLQTLPWIHACAKKSTKRKTLVSVYYDTKTCTLRDSGVFLRVRHIGNTRFQAIKATTDAPFARREWEKEISGDKPDFHAAHGTALAPLLSRKLEHNVIPIFKTRVRRTSLLIQSGKSQVELAMDRGTIQSGGKSRRISEIELELKKGDISALCKIAMQLSSTIAVRYDAQTKPERGYALLEGHEDEAVGSEPIRLKKHADIPAAFQVIGFSCLRHLTRNEDAVRRRDPEGIHQMRVGLRRLRAAISIFKRLLKGQQLAHIKGELKWLTEQLGPARDYDVFLKERVTPLLESQLHHSGIKVLQSVLRKKRAAGFVKAADAVESERYSRLTLGVALWLANGSWRANAMLTDGKRTQSLTAFAREALVRRADKIIRKLRKLKQLDPLHRHKLRIAVKKLRYATDFFDGLFSGSKKERKKFKKTLEELQDALGKLNDIQVHETLSDRIARGRPRQTRLATEFVKGMEQQDVKPLLRTAAKIGADLAKLKPF